MVIHNISFLLVCLAKTNRKSDSLFIYFKISKLILFFSLSFTILISHLLLIVLAKCNHPDISFPPGSINEVNGFNLEFILSISFSK